LGVEDTLLAIFCAVAFASLVVVVVVVVVVVCVDDGVLTDVFCTPFAWLFAFALAFMT
jgi:hypothetical protein